MLQAGVTEPSNSPWSSPVCMVKKKADTHRFCIDYCRLKDVTKKDAYPVPDVKDALDSLRGAKYFATIDLLSGYWQLGMTDRAKECSAFCTRRGLFQFTRMPFGLSNAPSSFCRLMHIILKDLLYVQCLCYLDDIVVFANSPEQLLERLDALFSRLRSTVLKPSRPRAASSSRPLSSLGTWFLPMALNHKHLNWIPSKIGLLRTACVTFVPFSDWLVITVVLSRTLLLSLSRCHD